MKKLSLTLTIFILASIFVSGLSAKCYGFRDADFKVCVNGDSFADRKKASDVCKSVKGSDCGGITGNSGSCTGSKCYDESGKKNSNIKTSG